MELGHILRHTVLSLRLSPPHLSPVYAWEVQGPANVTQGCHLMKRDQLDIPYQFFVFCFCVFFFFFFFKTVLFIYFWRGLVFITSHGLSLGAAGRGCSLVVVWRLLIWWLLTVAHGLLGMQAAVVAALRLGRCSTWDLLLCGTWDLPRRGIEPMYPAMAGQFLTTGPPGKPSAILIHRVLIPFHI